MKLLFDRHLPAFAALQLADCSWQLQDHCK